MCDDELYGDSLIFIRWSYNQQFFKVLVGILSFWFDESFNESIIDLDLNLGNLIQYLHFRNGD